MPLLRFSKFIESPPDVRFGSKADLAPSNCYVHFTPASSTGRRNTLSLREKIDYRPISQRFRGGTRAAEKIALWDSWLRRGSLKAIGRAFGKPSTLFIASWPPVLRPPVEITDQSGQS